MRRLLCGVVVKLLRITNSPVNPLRAEGLGPSGAAPLQRFRHTRLVTEWTGERVDERSGARRVVPDPERGVEVEDVAGCEAAAGAVDREHVAVDFVEVDVLEH